MGKRILILDDDADFNNLLTDIYTQADYDVVSEHDPEEAVERFASQDFDLVVTDQKMPGLSGEEFIREIKRQKPRVPVIMVSGYLDNDTIRNLIREGVGGVFLKPLNVFSLLKRTSALIEEAEAIGNGGSAPSGEQGAAKDVLDFKHSLPFAFESYPCRAGKSQEFAKKLFSLRGFKHNLVLIGEEGSDVSRLLHDLKQFERNETDDFRMLDLSRVEEDYLLAQIEEATAAGATRLTLLVPRVDLLARDKLDILIAASKHKGAFAESSIGLRFIFFVHDEIDQLYDTGRINDDLYMFLGTSEVKLPALREIRDDIPLIAQKVITAECKQSASPKKLRLDQSACAFLREHEWSGGILELKRVARAAAHLDIEQDITREDIEKATKNVGSGSGDSEHNLFVALKVRRDDYVSAIHTLTSGDDEQTTELLGVEPKALVAMLAQPAKQN